MADSLLERGFGTFLIPYPITPHSYKTSGLQSQDLMANCVSELAPICKCRPHGPPQLRDATVILVLFSITNLATTLATS